MINISNLSFGYGRERLFADLNLSLPPGGICGLLGKNGAGKTTLLKLIAGLRFPKAGRIEVSGRSPSDRSVGFLQDLFFLPEEFELPPVTPWKYETLYAPFYPRFQKDRFRELLRGFDVTGDKKLSGLSYGQKKRFLIAFGLSTGCRLILMDEPTNGLDIPIKSRFRKAVASSLAEDQLYVISTHQVRDLESLIDPVVIVDDGDIVLNQYQETISKRLKVVRMPGTSAPADAIFFENQFGSSMAVVENNDGQASGIDLETLFNSVVGNRSKIARIFGEGNAE